MFRKARDYFDLIGNTVPSSQSRTEVKEKTREDVKAFILTTKSNG